MSALGLSNTYALLDYAHLQEILIKGKATPKSLAEKEAGDAIDITIEEVQKDINALSREEQMDVVYRQVFSLCCKCY